MQPKHTLSVIYPVHIIPSSKYILQRLLNCLQNTQSAISGAEHIVVLSGKSSLCNKAKSILTLASHKLKVKLIETEVQPPYSPGIARNIGIEASEADLLLFWDIDLLGSPNLFHDLENQISLIRRQPERFAMYPCFYLTPESSLTFNNDFKKTYSDVCERKENCLEHIALATSTILCHKKHLEKIGFFDESFQGHMGEDLELINRLALNYPIHGIYKDHLLDRPSKIPNELKGFRQLFARYSTDFIEQKAFTVHIAHPTKLGSRYKKNQKHNMQYALQKMERSIDGIALLEINDEKLGNSPYLQQAPKISLTRKERLTRKFKKLIRQPKLFFKDAYKK